MLLHVIESFYSHHTLAHINVIIIHFFFFFFFFFLLLYLSFLSFFEEIPTSVAVMSLYDIDSTSITPDIILDAISELCGLDVGKMSVGVEVDPEGFVVRFVLYCDDEGSAISVADKMRPGNCQSEEFYCQVADVRVSITFHSLSGSEKVNKRMMNVLVTLYMTTFFGAFERLFFFFDRLLVLHGRMSVLTMLRTFDEKQNLPSDTDPSVDTCI